MIKSNRGITLLSLAITIVVLAILTGVSLTSGTSVIKQVKVGRMVSNMMMVQAKVEIIYEDYQSHNQDTTLLESADGVAYKLSNLGIALTASEQELIAQKAGVSVAEVANWDWYKWNTNTLEKQGLDKKMLSEENAFYVNYEHAEIIDAKGSNHSGEGRYYSMTGLQYVLEND